MPYKLSKLSDGTYQVVTKDTGKPHSKVGLPLARAKAQMRALYAAMKPGEK